MKVCVFEQLKFLDEIVTHFNIISKRVEKSWVREPPTSVIV